MVSQDDPELAGKALDGLAKYEQAPRLLKRDPRPGVATAGAVTLRDHGGSGPPLLLVPSLINPPSILDLDEHVSLADALSRMGRRVLLVDWGEAAKRPSLSVSDHVEESLRTLIVELGEPPALLGYCLGGTMAIAAANLAPIERMVTLAAPWNFARYPQGSHDALQDMWRHSRAAAKALGALPMEVLQASFWSLDPERTVRKFAEFGRLDPASDEARRFIELEEWANEGEPLPFPAAKELVEELFGNDRPGTGGWTIGGRAASDRLSAPSLHLTAERDLIAPPQTVAAGNCVAIPTGHVGMIVGSARQRLHEELKAFLTPCR